MRVVPNPPSRFLALSQLKTRLALNAIVNFDDTRPTTPGLRIFFQGKRASQQPFQIPCVFSSKTLLGFNVAVNLGVMPTAPKFLIFFQRKRALQESCRIPRVHFPSVFSSRTRLGFTSDREFTGDAANRSQTPNIFPRKTRLRGDMDR